MNILPKAFILISVLLAYAGSGAYAAHMVTTGTFVPFINKAQVSDEGATQKFELTPYIGYGQQIHINGPHYFMPEIALAYYVSPAKKTKKRVVFLHYDFSYILSSAFILRYGLSTYWYTQSGDGGTVTLRNGNNYSKFKAPSKTSTSYFSTLDFGGEFFIRQTRSIRLDFNMMNARDFKNRAYNYILTYNWYL